MGINMIRGILLASSMIMLTSGTLPTQKVSDYAISDASVVNSNNKVVDRLNTEEDYKFRFIAENKPLKPFVNTTGGTGSEALYGMISTDDKGYVAVGLTNSSNYDLSGLNKGSDDGIIMKVDNVGKTQWVKTFGGSDADVFTKVTKSTDGNGYVAVGYTGSRDKDFEGMPHVSSGRVGHLAKYDDNGNVLLKQKYSPLVPATDGMLLFSIKPLKDGGYILAGHEGYGTPFLGDDPYDGTLIKVDKDGNKVWHRKYGGSKNELFEMAIETKEGDIVAIGKAYSNDGDITGSMYKGHNDAQIVKYDKDGSMIWKKSFGGSGDDSFRDITLTDDGGYIAVGYTESNNMDLSGIKQNGTARDALIVKFDSQGNVAWKRTVGGSGQEYLLGIQQDNEGNFVTTGFGSSNDGDFNGMNNGAEDAIVIKIEDKGSTSNIIWKRTFGGSGSERLRAIVSLPDGGYAIAGNTNSTDKEFTGKNKGSDDCMIVKFDKDGSVDFTNYDESIGAIDYKISAILDSGKQSVLSGDFRNIAIPINTSISKEVSFRIPRIVGIKELELRAKIIDSEDNNASNNETVLRIPVNKVITTNPVLKLSLNTYDFTNKDVTITGVASDNFGVEYIITPDGIKMYKDKVEYVVSKNGVYTFVAYNSDGLFTIKSIEVTNIDKDSPSVSISKSPNETWTNKPVNVTVSATD